MSQTTKRFSPRKSLSEQYKSKFDMKLNFQSLQLDEKKLAEQVISHLNIDKNSNSEQKVKVAAYMEIYSIQKENTLVR